MKISQLNLSSFVNKNISKTPNFRGLWGETSGISDQDPGSYISFQRQTYYYYPYADETQEEIDLVVNRNTNAYLDDETSSEPIYVIKDCKVCARLPFTSQEFNEYFYGGGDIQINSKVKNIHLNVIDKYLNNNLGSQNRAVNTDMHKHFGTYI